MHPVMRSFQPSAKALHKRSCDEFTSGNFEFDAQDIGRAIAAGAQAETA
jgi:hypothetical protein